jgi:hypothetical protein
VTLGGFDRERSEAVRIEEVPGGATRWVPSRVAFDGAGEIAYADPACTTAVPTKIARGAACPITAVLAFTSQCGSSTVLYGVGPRVDPAQLRRRTEAGACAEMLNPSGVLAFQRGDLLPADELAPASLTLVESGLIRRRGFAGPDSPVTVSWGELVDTTSASPCVVDLAVDGRSRCLPSTLASVVLFSDPACESPAFVRPLTGCETGEPARFVRSSSADGARTFEVTGEASALFQVVNGACVPHTPPVPSRGFAVRELDVARFAEAVAREL